MTDRSRQRAGGGSSALLVLLFAALGGGEGSAQERSAPLTLEEAVERALDSNRDVQDARLALQVARRQATEAWGNVYPSLSLNASYTRNVSPAKSFLPAIIFNPDADPNEQIQVQFGADNQWNSTLSLEQPLFQGQAFVGVGAASRFRSLQEEVLRGRSQAVVTQVRLAYYDLLLVQEHGRLLENSVARVRESLRETEALAQAGLASEYEVLRLQVEVANLEPVLRQALNSVSRNRRVLAVLLDLDPEEAEGLEVAGSLASLDLENLGGNDEANRGILTFVGVESVPATGSGELDGWLTSRSELRQLTLTEELRRAELRAEQSLWLPQINLFANYQVNAQQNGGPRFFGRDETERFQASSVGVSLSWTIFNGFQREARISQRQSQLRQASTQSELARDRSRSELELLVEEIEEATLRARGQRLAVSQATRGYEIASAQYREGLGSRLELTDSEGALRQSEFNYAQAVFDVLAARARLDEAVGVVPGVDRAMRMGN